MDVVARLRAAGCVFAEDEARVLEESASSPAELAAWVERRTAGEPLEQIVGWVAFGGLRLAVGPGVFVPRRRTEILARAAAASVPAGGTLLDLCCGVGAVGAYVRSVRPDVRVVAADVDPAAVAVARRNLPGADVYAGDLYDALGDDLRGRIDAVAVNAPYVPTDRIALMPPEARDHEPALALDGGPDGISVHRRVAAGAAPWLAAGGRVLVETSRGQAPWTALALAEHGLHADLASYDAEIETAVVRGAPAVAGLPVDQLPPCEFALPGPLRERLVALVVAGTKTSTTALADGLFLEVAGDGRLEPEPGPEAESGLPAVGERFRVVDSAGATACVIETTSLRLARLADVDLAHAVAEGEGDETVAGWRNSHEAFWNGAQMQAWLGERWTPVDDGTLAVLERFRLVEGTPGHG